MRKIFYSGLFVFITVWPLLAQERLKDFPDNGKAFGKIVLEELNTDHLEIRPLISADGNTIFFSRRKVERGWRKKRREEIYVAQKDPVAGGWGAPARLGDQLNNKRCNAVAGINPNGKELVLFNTYKDTENVPLVRTIKQRGTWGLPQEIHIQDYENFSPYSDFFVDFEQGVLLMAIQPHQTMGGQDLFVSFPDGRNGWTKPLNMGPVVNSEKSDFAPFMGADGKTLFFSSYGHKTHGGSDIFMTVRLDDSWTNWSVPANLGPQINTVGDENYFSVDHNFEYLYFSSQESGKEQGRIMRVTLPEDFTAINGPVLVNLHKDEIQRVLESGNFSVNPNGPVANAAGEVFDVWRDVVSGKNQKESAPILEEKSERKEIASQLAKGNNEKPTGEIKSLLSSRATALLDYLQQELPGIDFVISLKGDTTEYELVQDILYGFNRVYVEGEYQQRLNVIANVLKNNEDLKVQLKGHTDNIGSPAVNQRVARLRVDNVLLYLTSRGVNRNRVEIMGVGQSTPAASNSSVGGRRLNRRVETLIRYIEH